MSGLEIALWWIAGLLVLAAGLRIRSLSSHRDGGGVGSINPESLPSEIQQRTGHRPMKLSRLLCFIGIHRFRVVEKTASFGSAGVERVQCQRCGLTFTRQG